MKFNLAQLKSGRFEVGSKVIDLYDFQIRDQLSSDSIRKYSLECADKIKNDSRFTDEKSRIAVENFYKHLSNDVEFLPDEPKLVSYPKILYYKNHPQSLKATIVIPNDYDPSRAKASAYHETLHFFFHYYNPKIGSESLVDSMTDFYLQDDEKALFQERWLGYSLTGKGKLALA